MKKYCTQNNGDCETCSLVNYGRDCENVPLTETLFECESCGTEAGKVGVCSVCGKILCKDCIYHIGPGGYREDVFCSTCVNAIDDGGMEPWTAEN